MEQDSSIVTAEEAASRFGDLLARVEARREEIEVVRNGAVVARIVPAARKPKTVADFRKAWRDRTRLDPEDAVRWEKELEELRANTPLPPPPAWD
jgi:prevent-host-death family protein